MAKIRVEEADKGRYLPLLLEADPSQDMIARYLEDGILYVLEEDGRLEAAAVVLPLGEGKCELKNIAVAPQFQGKGLGSRLLEHVFADLKGRYEEMLVGTTTPVLPFYHRHGFVDSHVVKNFFTDNYPEPIYENGVQCVDMLYLRKRLEP